MKRPGSRPVSLKCGSPFLTHIALFEAAWKATPIVNEMTSRTFNGQLSHVVARMVFAAANTIGALITLVCNGYGHDAMKLARSI
jgi:hypothetical protein